MTKKEAKEIIDRCRHLEKPMQDPIFQTELKLAIYSYMEAKGYLEGLNGPEAKAREKEIRNKNLDEAANIAMSEEIPDTSSSPWAGQYSATRLAIATAIATKKSIAKNIFKLKDKP